MSLSAGRERAIGLLDPARRPPAAPIVDGYIDLFATRALEERGFEDIRRRVSGLAQFVGARRTPA